MVLPIVAYGHSILRQKCEEIGADYPKLDSLIDSMWETLYPACGSGLAAPQVNHPVKLFIVDSREIYDSMEQEDRDEFFAGDNGIRETFINANITGYSDRVWGDQEGCLSIPGISEQVERPWSITIEYLDDSFRKQVKTFSGVTARVIQHEYDHTNGKLYIDYLSPIKRKILGRKLTRIANGLVKPKYPMQ